NRPADGNKTVARGYTVHASGECLSASKGDDPVGGDGESADGHLGAVVADERIGQREIGSNARNMTGGGIAAEDNLVQHRSIKLFEIRRDSFQYQLWTQLGGQHRLRISRIWKI